MWCSVGTIIGSSSSSRRNQAAWRMWREKKQKKRRKNPNQQKIKQKKKKKQIKTKNKRTEMRTQEQKQYDENEKYIHKCMKQNCNREETEGEELTASGRGGLSLHKVGWP